jgi:hypothetical protein
MNSATNVRFPEITESSLNVRSVKGCQMPAHEYRRVKALGLLPGRRLTTLNPFSLSDEFLQDLQKQIQWQAFLRKNALDELRFSDVVTDLRARLSFPLDAHRQGAAFPQTWRAINGWMSSGEEPGR